MHNRGYLSPCWLLTFVVLAMNSPSLSAQDNPWIWIPGIDRSVSRDATHFKNGITKTKNVRTFMRYGENEFTDFHVNDNGFNDLSLKALEKLPNLTHLDISSTKVSDNGLSFLVNFPKLTHLNLSGIEVTDEILGHLGKLKNLVELNLNQAPLDLLSSQEN